MITLASFQEANGDYFFTNHFFVLGSVLKNFKSMSATFSRPLSLGWVPSAARSCLSHTSPSLFLGVMPSAQK
jgi:hypothetical protein